MITNGYAGNILRINLSTGEIGKELTDIYAESFMGGRGIAAKIYWDEVSPNIDALDPENRLIFVTGPICGVPGFAGSRWQICGKSPIGNQFSFCNLGGSWGAQLKFAGFDGIVIQGKADKLSSLIIDNDRIELKATDHLKGKGAIKTREILKDEFGKSFRVLAVGPAGENMVTFATLLADDDSSGSGGLGAVMGSKNLKAIIVKGDGRVDIADPDRVKELRKRVRELKSDIDIEMETAPPEKLKKNICYGCINGCIRADYIGDDGDTGKFFCQSALFYIIRAERYYGEKNDIPYKVNKICDDYGVDTRAIETMLMWLNRCYKSKILTEEDTGLLLSKIGSLEFIDNLVEMISFRYGFGDLLANGTFKAAETVGQESDKLITDYMVKSGENDVYGPRQYITTGIFYAMEPRMPIQHLHEISIQVMTWAYREMGMDSIYLTSDVLRSIAQRFWGSEIAADFSTYEGKALAAARIQDRQYAKESLILCDLSWPIIHSHATEGHLGDPTLESKIYKAVTGRDVDETGLYKIAERIFNLQRAILISEGRKGREDDTIDEYNYTVPLKSDFGNPQCIVPGRNGEVFSRKGMVVDRDEFEKMKDEYYEIRGWDVATGLQKKSKLDELGLSDVATRLELQGLLA
ncbi:MAG: aldehyde ferredoxin oxidoreductase N-terminal domain-containing protein [Spirochaetota bacterium]|nr:aldehyde ferredoxin oxidoreductase N-terminal domain-containing protein [Spirochaetota bacterium]